MAQKLMTKKSLVQWCDEQVAQGKNIGIGWEGGGDSGWCYFTIDGRQVENTKQTPEMEELVDLMYDHLDYGSWAGEFNATGEAEYDPKQKAFVGTDYYSEDDTHYQECEIPIRVPKHLWFDSLEYNMESEEIDVQVAFIIRNGFLTQEHHDAADYIAESIAIDANEVVNKYTSQDNAQEYRSVWQNDRIQRSAFQEDGDFLVYTIEELNIGIEDSNEKLIYLELETEDDDSE